MTNGSTTRAVSALLHLELNPGLVQVPTSTQTHVLSPGTDYNPDAARRLSAAG